MALRRNKAIAPYEETSKTKILAGFARNDTPPLKAQGRNSCPGKM
jgi:hypothetical protein